MSGEHHANRTRLFTIVFVLLVILTGISFAVANSSIMEQPVKGWIAMMVISIAKALLVIIFFMHLRWETNWKYVLTIPAAVMSSLLVLILIPDIGNRTETYSAERQKFAAYELDVDEPPSQTKKSPEKANQNNAAKADSKSPGSNSDSKDTFADAPGDWGTLKGRFVVKGNVPQPIEITPDADQAACKLPMFRRDLIVSKEGGLKNVVIFLTKPDKQLPIHPYYEKVMQTPVELDNKYCRFEPHITLLTNSQTLVLKNSDAVGHNANVTSFNDENNFNEAIPSGNTLEKKLPIAESRPIEVACTSHRWMRGYIMVRNEPYMAVSNDKGEFQIDYFPAGKWQIQFWHENAGYLKGCIAGGREITQGRKGLVDIEIKKNSTFDLGTIEINPETSNLVRK